MTTYFCEYTITRNLLGWGPEGEEAFDIQLAYPGNVNDRHAEKVLIEAWEQVTQACPVHIEGPESSLRVCVLEEVDDGRCDFVSSYNRHKAD